MRKVTFVLFFALFSNGFCATIPFRYDPDTKQASDAISITSGSIGSGVIVSATSVPYAIYSGSSTQSGTSTTLQGYTPSTLPVSTPQQSALNAVQATVDALGFVLSGTYSSDLNLSGTTLKGLSSKQTILTMTGTSKVVITGSNTHLKNLRIIRSGTSDLPVFSCNVTGTSDWLPNLTLENVDIISSGTAVGTLTARTRDCYISGSKCAVEMWYGNQHFGTVFENPTLYTTGSYATEPAAYVIKFAQSVGTNANTWGSELDQTLGDKAAALNSCRLIGRGVNTRVIFGLNEAAVSGSASWMASTVCAYPPLLNGCEVYGPQPPTDNDSLGGVGTNAACFAGTLSVVGGSVQGNNTFMNIHDGRFVGIYALNWGHGLGNYLLNGNYSCIIQDSYFASNADIANQGGAGTYPGFYHCFFENDIIPHAKGSMTWFHGCWDASNGLVGYERSPLALRSGTGASRAVAFTASTTAFTANPMTVEYWMRSGTTGSDNASLGYWDTNSSGWFIGEVNQSNQVYAHFGSTTANLTSGAGVYDNAWHHVAATVSGTVVNLFIDGALVKSGTGTTTMSGSSRLCIGGRVSSSGNGAPVYHNGDLTEIRISNSERYTGTFTPPKRLYPDASTLALFADETSAPLTWTDQMGVYDANLDSENSLYWVPRFYSVAP